MLICGYCMATKTKNNRIATSFGPCEECGGFAGCADIRAREIIWKEALKPTPASERPPHKDLRVWPPERDTESF